MKKRTLKCFAAQFICLIFAFNCFACPALASDELTQPKDRVFGDWLVRVLSAEPATLNPITATDAYAGTVDNYIYQTLLKRDEKSLKLVPVLARKWTISPDHLTYTFYLKKNVKWSDGYPFTAKDVLFSFHMIMDPKVDAAPLRSYYQDIEKVDAPNDYTVRFHYRIPYFLALEMCGGLPIVPAHLFKKGEDFNSSPIGRQPVGTGPYELLRWKTGSEIVLVRNKDYWGQKPALDRIIFKIITDSTVALQVLKQGGLDMMSLEPIQWARETETKRFNERFRKLSYYQPQYSFIGWNCRRAIFSDKRVRQAMTMLVPRELILKKILFGLGAVVTGPFYINSPDYDKNIKPYPYDPKAALALLKSAGWNYPPGSYVLEKDGKPFKFQFLIPAGAKLPLQIATILKENLHEIGIEMSIERLEWAVFLQRINDDDFDACTLGWALGWENDPYQIWDSSQAVKNGSNFVGFKNAEADKLIMAARKEFNPEKRRKMYYRLQEIIHDEQPYTFLFTTKALVAVSRRFQNVVVYPMGLAPRYWWVPKAEQKY
ncbi:MAG: peptide-binding protein [Deltaproteobacteria bacterium]|jgi:peptide/nickel transport system substrate-binding protein|nr:peptide-binding protein [Deltaproteobacteria bacterium]